MKINLLLIFFIVSFSAYSQNIIINGKEGNRKLSWSDFTGKVDEGASFYAYTAYKFNQKIENIKTSGDSLSIGKFELNVELDPVKTWAKKDNKLTDALLVHEQGHFDIGILCMREILSVVKQAKFTKSNFRELLQTIYSDASKKYNEMGVKYDDETQHSANTVEQAKWNSFFAEQLSN